MKRLFTIITLVLLTATVCLPTRLNAQSPKKMSYQSVIRNASDQLVTNQDMGMQISILQGSAGGTAVYVETHSPTSNVNGLVTIEIGTGITSDDFSAIDWTSGPYFLKTETDPGSSGGTNYTITGTSQLLSVPYAMHANTAENFSETDPVFSGSQANNITGTDITNLSNLSGINTGDQDLSGLATQIALEDTAYNIRSDIPNVTTYSVGDFAQGGVVFWVDETSEHGLVCAKEDQSSGERWFAGTSGNTQAKGDGPFSGETNTSIIIAAQVAIGDDGSTYAARICNELQITEGGKIYGNWYLPAKEELNLMYQNKAIIDATAVANGGSAFITIWYYWSSNEFSSGYAWVQHFNLGNQFNNSTGDATGRVRAVRAF